jgi:hypothetical protein
MYDYQTSLPAYQVAQKNINKKQQTVLEAITELGTCCDHQIAEHLDWPINRVTPRRGELIEAGRIQFAFRGKDFETGRTVNFWKPTIFLP